MDNDSTQPAGWTHALLLLERLTVAVVLAYALPTAHELWGESPPPEWDGNSYLAILVGMWMVSAFVALLYFIACSIVHIFATRSLAIVATDVTLGVLVFIGLVMSGIVAHHN